MTAEIVIMNTQGVALAADSAETVTQEGGAKIFTSASKIFALSKYHPVGIMVYGNAALMDLHWETLIKMYRAHLGSRACPKLQDYADNFIAFLDGENPLFPAAHQERHFYSEAASYFWVIRREIEDEVRGAIEAEGEVDDSRVAQLVAQVIDGHFEHCESAGLLPSMPESRVADLVEDFGDGIDTVRQEVLEELPISDASVDQLRRIAAALASKDVFPTETSGVVVTGYGEEDAFPALKSFMIDGIAKNKLKYKEELSTVIGFEELAASITPFAQHEMVRTFIEGVDPNLQEYMTDQLGEVFGGYPDVIVDSMEGLDESGKQALSTALREASGKIFADYQERVSDYQRQKHIDPIISVVRMLPKAELAEMAEALVSLTSFKRRVTLEPETVGGPIDVAVISKGDGFIWIKRKHYFRGDLNPKFFANYFREVPGAQGEKT